MMTRSTAMIRTSIVISVLGIGACLPAVCSALTYVLPGNGNIVGNIQYTTVRSGENLSTIGRQYDLGGYEMVEANPGVNYSNPRPGTSLVIPSRFILPDAPRKGIVINLAEMRLYFYHTDGLHVSTYPVGVGQEGWNTPLGKTQIVRKREHPTWVVPDSILENQERHGKPIDKVMPPGPNNPLGDYAMNLAFQNIVIHGSPYPKGVGVRSSHGCIRMLNEDVAELFRLVSVGTPVNIIHQPTKIGHLNNKLYLEAHVPISPNMAYEGYQSIGSLIHKLAGDRAYSVEWQEVERIKSRANGYPLPIGSILSKIRPAQAEEIPLPQQERLYP